MFQRILVPLNGSSRAEQALTYAVELYRLAGDQSSSRERSAQTLLLVRVVPSSIMPPARFSMAEADIWLIRQAQMKQEATEYLAAVANRFDLAWTMPQWLVAEGQIGPSLVHIIKGRGIDVVVMIARRRRRLARWVLGSTADYVMRRTPTPVLLVHEEVA